MSTQDASIGGTREHFLSTRVAVGFLWEFSCSNVLVGNDLVDWMVQQPWCRDRAHAETVGQRLLDAGFIHHVTHAHPFRDKALFYRLRDATAGGPGDVILNAAERSAAEYVRAPHTPVPAFVRRTHKFGTNTFANASLMNAVRQDLVVIGAGAAGLTAASFAGKMGARVALIEKNQLGGDCTWTGCVPSKTLLSLAKKAHNARHCASDGVEVVVRGEVQVNMPAIQRRIQSIIQHIYEEETPAAIARKGVDVILGEASFTSNRSVCVRLRDPATPVISKKVETTLAGGSEDQTSEGGAAADATVSPVRHITANNFVIATGASAIIPPTPGLADVPFHTYETIFQNATLPRKMVVMGTGPIGAELAQAYSMLGSEVTIFGSHLLAKESLRAQDTIARVFEEVHGIQWVRSRPDKVELTGAGTPLGPNEPSPGNTIDADAPYPIRVTAGSQVAECDLLLVSVGRGPVLDSLQLQEGGVTLSEKGGLVTNDSLQTNVRHIFACGDCIEGIPQFTHLAGKQGFVAARNALFPGNFSGKNAPLPRCTYTEPEVAAVGLTEEEALEKHGSAVTIHRRQTSHIDRNVCEGDIHGFVSLAVLSDGKIAGATIVGERAGELITEVTLAMQNSLRASEIALTIHPYPTHSMGVQQVASEAGSQLFMRSFIGKFVRSLYSGQGESPTEEGGAEGEEHSHDDSSASAQLDEVPPVPEPMRP